MRLVERDNELTALHGILAESVRSRGHVVLVSGPIGSGKTELLHAFAEQAVGKGTVFLSASGCRVERSVPFGVMNQLCHSAPLGSPLHERMASLLDDMQPTAARGADADEVSSAVANVMGGMYSALVELAEQHPVLIGIDDVQDADTPSLRCLLYLVRRLRSARALVLLTEDDDAQRTRRAFRTELLRLPRFTRLRLPLLSPQGVMEILAEQLDGPIPPGFAAVCYAVSGGNPLLLHALAEDHDNSVETGSDDLCDHLVVGDAFGQAVLTCLHRSEPATFAVAQGLAVLGESASPGLLSQLLAADAATDFAAVVRALRQLKRAGVLESGRFRHSAARLAVLDDTPPRILSDLHRRAAELQYQKGAPATAVAQHLVAANDPDHPWALSLLLDAGQDALRDDRLHLAFGCLELAARACADEEQRAVVTSALARAEWRANPATVVRHLDPLAAALQRGCLRGGHVADLIKFMLWHGHLDDARDALEGVSRRAADSDPETLAELNILRPWLRSSYPALHAHVPQLDAPVASLASTEVTSPTARLQLHTATALETALTAGPDDTLVESVEQLLQGADLDDSTVDAIESALLALIYANRPDRAGQWCGPLFDVAADRRAATWIARLASLKAEIALRQGSLPRAEQLARLALDTIPLRSWGVAVGAPLATLVSASTQLHNSRSPSRPRCSRLGSGCTICMLAATTISSPTGSRTPLATSSPAGNKCAAGASTSRPWSRGGPMLPLRTCPWATRTKRSG
jgi:AAA ATPase domain